MSTLTTSRPSSHLNLSMQSASPPAASVHVPIKLWSGAPRGNGVGLITTQASFVHVTRVPVSVLETDASPPAPRQSITRSPVHIFVHSALPPLQLDFLISPEPSEVGLVTGKGVFVGVGGTNVFVGF